MVTQSVRHELFGHEQHGQQDQQSVADFAADVSAGDPRELARLLNVDSNFLAELLADQFRRRERQIAFVCGKVIGDPPLERDLIQVEQPDSIQAGQVGVAKGGGEAERGIFSF